LYGAQGSQMMRRMAYSLITYRQQAVLRLLCAGKQLPEIADELGITVATVIAHRDRIRIRVKIDSIDEICRTAETDESALVPVNRPIPPPRPQRKYERTASYKSPWRRYATDPETP
jgi:DNA-binding CsgD family transcriptional regulator